MRPLPGGWLTRGLAVVVFLGLVAYDYRDPVEPLTTARGWTILLVSYLPILALAAGGGAAVVVWFLAFAVLLAMGGEAAMFFGLTVPGAPVLGVGLYLLPRRRAVIISAVVVASPVFLLLNSTYTVELAVVHAILNALTCLAGLGLNTLRHRSEKSEGEVDELRRRQAHIRREERTRLAYELHDIVAHDVTVMAMQARRAQIARDPAVTADALDSISDAAQKVLDDLHSLVVLLKESEEGAPAGVDQESLMPEPSGETTTAEGFVADVRAVADAVEHAGFRVRLVIEGQVELIPTSVRQALRRTVRELGTNVLKHGDPAGEVELTLVVAQAVTLSASNAVAGTDPIASSSSGIEGMRARCEVFGGDVVAAAQDGRWTTTTTIPLAARTESAERRILV